MKDKIEIPKKIFVTNQYYEPDIASTGKYATGICSGLASRGL